jgi:hypothetical protein
MVLANAALGCLMMRTTQAKLFTWVFIAVVLTFWVVQSRRSNPYLHAREVTITQLADESKQQELLYLGSDEDFHYFQTGADEELYMSIAMGSKNGQLYKLPKDVWTAPERRRFGPLPFLPVVVKDGKITQKQVPTERRRRGEPDGSGEDRD